MNAPDRPIHLTQPHKLLTSRDYDRLYGIESRTGQKQPEIYIDGQVREQLRLRGIDPATVPDGVVTQELLDKAQPSGSSGAAQAWFWSTAPREKTEIEQETDFLNAHSRNLEKRAELEKLKQGVVDVPGGLVLRRADMVAIESVYWLWPGFVACKFLNLLVGETAAGKSTVLADVAARVTTGRAWPGEPETAVRTPGRVLWLGSEDPMEVLTVPRLMSCAANLGMVTEIQAVRRNDVMDSFSMQDDIEKVRFEIANGVQFGSPYAMLVIDPITSYLHGGRLRKIDMNDSGQLRAVLEPWIRLAQETGIAIVGVTHLAKDTTRSMLHRVLGGGAFAQLCRSLVAVVNIPDGDPHQKAVVQVKTNLPGMVRGGWRFKTELAQVGADRNGTVVTATRPDWIEYDHSLTPEQLAGGARGPVSTVGAGFGPWLQAQFVNVPHEQGLPVEQVKAAAVEAKVATARWWNDNSKLYLNKQNRSGVWWCRPKT